MIKVGLYDTAREVGSYTLGRIIPLQKAYLGKGARTSAARASLARLRRLGTAGEQPWFSIGFDLFEGWPEDRLGIPSERSQALRAVRSALQLYALHQQSQARPMALVRDAGDDLAQGDFGRACRRIAFDLDRAKGVRRRLAQVEAADDFDGMVYTIRALVSLLRSQGIPLDYGALAGDLYLLQFETSKGSVFARWSRNYYLARENEQPADQPVGA